MSPVVNGQIVAEVISGWTGIPIGKMVADEIQAVLNLHKTLGERVLGQDHALESITQRIRTARAGLTDPKRPIGVFLLVGTSGVGKTETALALSRFALRRRTQFDFDQYERISGSAHGFES